LPQINSLPELQVTLHVLWRTAPGPHARPWLAAEELRQEPLLLQALADEPGGALAALSEGLERAIGRGTLLRAVVRYSDLEREVVAPNTGRGRRGLATLRDRASGETAPSI